MASDDFQGVRQSRVLDTGIPVHRQVVDVEKPLSGRSFGRAAAGCPLAFEIRIIDHGQPAVEAFQGEGNRVERGERRPQQALLRQCFGRSARKGHLVEQGEPACPRQRYQGFVRAACLGKFRGVDHVHEQACAARRGYPYDAAPHGQRARGQGLRQTGFGQRGRAREAAYKTRKRVGSGDQRGIGLFRQFGWMDLGQQRCRQSFQQGARQSLGDHPERGVLVMVVLFVRRDARQQPPLFEAQQMLGCRLLHPVP